MLDSNHRPQDGASWPFPDRAHEILHAAPHPVVCYDRDLRVVWLNPAAADFTGAKPHELQGRRDICLGGHDRCSHPADCPVAGALATGLRQERVCPSARLRQLKVRAEPVKAADGSVLGVVEFAHEFHQPATPLPAEPGRLLPAPTVLDAIEDAVFIHDADTAAILDANEAAARMWGCSREEMLALGIGDLVEGAPPYDLPEAMRRFALAREKGKLVFEWPGRTRAGRVFWMEVCLRRGTVGEIDRIFATVRDITERKQLEEERARNADAMRQSEERFRQLLSRVPTVAVQGYAPDGTVRYWNEASERLYGHRAHEVLGADLLDLVVPPGARDEARAAIRAMAESGVPIPAGEIERMRKDGSRIAVFSSHAVVDVAGRGPEFYCLDIDLTERKRSEQERLEMERCLARGQKHESLGVLTGGIAHDFNNLLAAIIGNLDLGLAELSPLSAARPCLEDAMRASKSAADLVRQMLAYSGRVASRSAALEIDVLLARISHLLRAAVPSTASFSMICEPDLPVVHGDPSQIEQIVTNLVTNAAEAVGEAAGSVVVRIGAEEADAARLAESCLEDKPIPGRFVFVEVQDTGCGMSAHVRGRMFDPFFTTKFAGRGLGMAVVLGLVRKHAGALFVASAEGRGTTVRVLFPAPPPVPESAAPRSPAGRVLETASEAPPTRGTLLIVDDDEPIRRIAQRMGAKLGFHVAAAADGAEGVSVFSALSADITCVVLDLTMPKLGGVECFSAMREIRSGVPTILASGYPVDEVAGRFAGIGFAGFLQKPFTIQQFVAVLDRAVPPPPAS